MDLNTQELSEEDLCMKEQLDLYVQIIHDPKDPALQRHALESLKHAIRSSTTSLTSVPKPLKFLRPHYESMKKLHETMRDADLQMVVADILSVLAMARADDSERECLKYRMLGCKGDFTEWGHEYVRRLAAQITEAYNECSKAEFKEVQRQSVELAQQIVAFFMKRNAEAEAVDLLLELNDLSFLRLVDCIDKSNYIRTCVYLVGVARFVPKEDGMRVMEVVYNISMYFEEYARALQAALFLEDLDFVKQVFVTCKDLLQKKQLCYMLGRHGGVFELDEEMVANENEREKLQEIVSNLKLSDGFSALARDLDVMGPKTPEDIYKRNVTGSGAAAVDSARQNLAATFVNAFVNAGFCRDKLMMAAGDESSGSWVFKNKDHGKISAAASLGVIFMWDVDYGITELCRYMHTNDSHVTAGALLGVGIVNSYIKLDYDPALALLGDYLDTEDSHVRIGAIMGLGIAYANTQNDEVRDQLVPILRDPQASLDVVVFAAIALGLVFVGSCNEEVANAIGLTLVERGESSLDEPLARLMPLSAGLLYLGKLRNVDAMKAVTGLCGEEFKRHCEMTLLSCAYAGSGDVLEVQTLLNQCAQQLEQGGTDQGAAVLGIATVAMAEELGSDMVIRSMQRLLQYGKQNVRKAVPLALALLSLSDPKSDVVDTLGRLSHDSDSEVAMSAIVSLGLVAAGTNNARTASMLRNLSGYYRKDAGILFCVQIAQGLVHLGKGLLTLNPYHSDRLLFSPVALSGLLVMLHSCLELKSIILGKYHYVLYFLVLAMQPRMLMTVDENLKPLPVPVKVGKAVDVAGRAGLPKTITGFQTHTTPVILSAGERAELDTEKYIPLSPILEGFVILKNNPAYEEEHFMG